VFGNMAEMHFYRPPYRQMRRTLALIKNNMRIFILLLIAINSFGQDSLNIELQSRIYEIYKTDQECRAQLRKYQNNELDTNEYSLTDITLNIHITDSLNYFKLRGIINEYGFPGFNLVGEDYSNSFWNIIQH